MDVWSLEQFKSLVGQSLNAKSLESGVSTLIKVKDVVEVSLLGEQWTSFTVVFEREGEGVIDQNNYEFEHEEYGPVTFFISPNSEREAEAVFNYKVAA